uniref:Uncharacterized protein n=1 Tax=Anguilla anguilla TaxID=7936 RepID=A0A0E9PIL9_ANGAN
MPQSSSLNALMWNSSEARWDCKWGTVIAPEGRSDWPWGATAGATTQFFFTWRHKCARRGMTVTHTRKLRSFNTWTRGSQRFCLKH